MRPPLYGSPLAAEHFELRPGTNGFRACQRYHPSTTITYCRNLRPIAGDPCVTGDDQPTQRRNLRNPDIIFDCSRGYRARRTRPTVQRSARISWIGHVWSDPDEDLGQP